MIQMRLKETNLTACYQDRGIPDERNNYKPALIHPALNYDTLKVINDYANKLEQAARAAARLALLR